MAEKEEESDTCSVQSIREAKKPNIPDYVMERAKDKRREQFRREDAAKLQQWRTPTTRPYEDAEEKRDMAKANPKALDQLKRFLESLASLSTKAPSKWLAARVTAPRRY